MTEKNFNVLFSESEATAALQLFDAAVKAGGLQVAGNAVHLTRKIQAAFTGAVSDLTPRIVEPTV